MVEDDVKKYLADFDKNSAEKEKILTELQRLQVVNVEQWRSFTSTLLTIDIAVIAAVLTLLSSETQTLIHTELQSLFGLIILKFTRDSAISGKPFEEFKNESLQKMKDFADEEQKITKAERAKEKGSWYLSAMSWLFIIGLIFVALSLFSSSNISLTY